MISTRIACLAVLVSGSCLGASVQFPGNPLIVSGVNSAGTSFVYNGTLTQSDTIAFVQSGNPCLQSSGTYCTNGAGVLTVAGSTGVGGSSSFAGPSGVIPAGTWTYGSLLLQISGVGTVQVFPTNPANGLGNSSPPATLTLPTTTLSALGFGAFSQVNPTITLIVADTGFTDNSGQFSLAQAVVPPPVQAPVPTLGAWALSGMIAMLAVVSALALRRRRTLIVSAPASPRLHAGQGGPARGTRPLQGGRSG